MQAETESPEAIHGAHRASGEGSKPNLALAALWWMSGANARLLMHDSCWLERARYTASGFAVLITSALAALSAFGVFDQFVLPGSPVLALLSGLAWGGVILSLDRLLLLTLYKRGDGKSNITFWVVAPRIGLAVLAACAVAVPAELVLFKRHLDVQVKVDQEQIVAEQQARLNQRYSAIPTLRADELALTTEIARAHDAAEASFSQAACEGDGTCGSGNSGAGVLHDEKKAHYDELAQAARATRAQDDVKISEIRRRIAVLEKSRDADLHEFQGVAATSDDLLSRLVALRHLEQNPTHGGTVSAAAWIVRLFSLALELLPLGLKITAPFGPYDAAVEAIQDGEAAQWRAVREKALERADVLVAQERMIGDGVRAASQEIISRAAQTAVTSRAARKAQRDLSDTIVRRSVHVARTAAANVFEDRRLHDDVVDAARAHRRRADERVAESEAAKSHAFDDLDEALRSAAELRESDEPLH